MSCSTSCHQTNNMLPLGGAACRGALVGCSARGRTKRPVHHAVGAGGEALGGGQDDLDAELPLRLAAELERVARLQNMQHVQVQREDPSLLHIIAANSCAPTHTRLIGAQSFTAHTHGTLT